jgi:hypothetical protein
MNPGRGQRFFCSPNHPDWLWGLPSFVFSGYQGSFSGVKSPGHDLDYTHPSSTKFENERSYISAPCVCLYGMHRATLNGLSQ